MWESWKKLKIHSFATSSFDFIQTFKALRLLLSRIAWKCVQFYAHKTKGQSFLHSVFGHDGQWYSYSFGRYFGRTSGHHRTYAGTQSGVGFTSEAEGERPCQPLLRKTDVARDKKKTIPVSDKVKHAQKLISLSYEATATSGSVRCARSPFDTDVASGRSIRTLRIRRVICGFSIRAFQTCSAPLWFMVRAAR